MTTVSGAREESAITVWGKTMLAMSQKAEAEKAIKLAAAEAANPGSTIVQLSDEAKARKAADDWKKESIAAIYEKARIENQRWMPGVQSTGNETTQELNGLISKASASDQEAYVQREMTQLDATIAVYEIIYKHAEMTHTSKISPLTEERKAHLRVVVERGIRQRIGYAGDGLTPFGLSTETRQVQHSPWPEKSAPPASDFPSTAKAAPDDWLRSDLERLRSKMGAGKLGKSDADPTDISKQLAVAQQRIDALQTEFSAIAEVWKQAADRGEKWALPHVVDPTSDNTGVNNFRYEESNEMYAPNIVGLSLNVAKWSLAVVESSGRDPSYSGVNFHSRYGDQVITTFNDYVTAAKDYISKLESQSPSHSG